MAQAWSSFSAFPDGTTLLWSNAHSQQTTEELRTRDDSSFQFFAPKERRKKQQERRKRSQSARTLSALRCFTDRFVMKSRPVRHHFSPNSARASARSSYFSTVGKKSRSPQRNASNRWFDFPARWRRLSERRPGYSRHLADSWSNFSRFRLPPSLTHRRGGWPGSYVL